MTSMKVSDESGRDAKTAPRFEPEKNFTWFSPHIDGALTR